MSILMDANKEIINSVHSGVAINKHSSKSSCWGDCSDCSDCSDSTSSCYNLC